MAGEAVPVEDLPSAAAVPEHDLPEEYQAPSFAVVARSAGALGRKRITEAASRAADIFKQQDPSVDYSGVNDAGNRATYSLLSTPEEKLDFVKKQYGAENVSTDSFGRPVVNQGGKRVSFEPRGDVAPSAAGNLAGYAGMAGDVLPVAGMMVGGTVGARAGWQGAVSGSGFGAATGEALNKLIVQGMGLNKQTAGETASDIGTQGALGVGAEGAGQIARLAGRTLLAPYAEKSLLGPNVEAKPNYRLQMDAVDKAREMGLTPRVGTFAPSAGFVQRAQNAGARLFGDPIPLRNQDVIKAGQQTLLTQAGATGEVSPDAVTAQGEAASTKVAAKAENVIQTAEQTAKVAETEAKGVLKGAQDRLTAAVGAPSGKLAANVAGDIEAAKNVFSSKASQLYAPGDELVGKPVVPTAGLKAAMQKILESLPQTAEGTNALASDATRAFAKGIDSLADFSTFQQMQNARILFRNKSAVDALNAGLSEGQARQLARAANQAFEDAASSITTKRTTPAGSILGEDGKPIVGATTTTSIEPVAGVDKAITALRRADQFYKAGIQRFSDLNVEALVKDATQTGFVQPEKVAQYIAAPGQVDRLMRIKKVVSPQTFDDIGKEKWQHLVGGSEDPLTGEVSGAKLATRLSQMGDSLDALYGPVRAGQMRDLAQHLAAMDGKLDPAALAQGTPMATAINKSIAAKAAFDKVASNDYLGMIRGDNGPQSLKAADWLTTPAHRLQLRNVISTLGPDAPEVQGLKEYLARKIMLTMEVPASDTEQKFGSTVLMGKPLQDELKAYGKPYLEEVFGKDWSDKMHDFADTVEVGTRRNPQDSGGLAAASIGLKWMHHLTDLAKYYSIGWATAKSPTITWMTKGMPGAQDTSALMQKLRGLTVAGTRGYIGTQAEEQTKDAADYAEGIKQRFAADETMQGHTLGRKTPDGHEVRDARGNLLGHYE